MTKTCKKCGEEISTSGKLCADCSLKLEQRLLGKDPASPLGGVKEDPDVVMAKAIAHPSERIGDTTIRPTERDVITPMLKGYLYWMAGGFIISFLLILALTLSSMWSQDAMNLPSLVLAFSFVLIGSMIFAFISGIIGAIVGDSKFAAWSVITILALTFAVLASSYGLDFALSLRK